MKYLIFVTIAFFLLVNTQSYWSPVLGFFSIFALMLLFAVFIGLIVMLLYHLVKAIKEKFTIKQRNILIISLVVAIGTTLYKPHGLIDFDYLNGADKLIAQKEGAANCMTTLKLKARGVFIESTFCFGPERIKGTYHIQNDTVWFNDSPSYYKFGVIGNKFDMESIELYKDNNDKNPLWLIVTKNDL